MQRMSGNGGIMLRIYGSYPFTGMITYPVSGIRAKVTLAVLCSIEGKTNTNHHHQSAIHPLGISFRVSD
jgi:hypothetical protein